RGTRKGTYAARCEHCEWGTRGTQLTTKTLHAEFNRPTPRPEVAQHLRGRVVRAGEEHPTTHGEDDLRGRAGAVSGEIDLPHRAPAPPEGEGGAPPSAKTTSNEPATPARPARSSGAFSGPGGDAALLGEAYHQLLFVQSLFALGNWDAIKKR